jgi:CHAT domain-containing protein
MHPGHPAAIIVLCCAALLFCDYLLADSNRTDSLDADKLIQLASRYEERGLRHQTAALLQEVSQMTTNVLQRQETDLKLAQLYFQLGQYPLCLNIVNRILSQSPPDPIRADALNTLGTVQSILNNPKAASASFSQAAAIPQDDFSRAVITANHLRHELDHGNRTAARSAAGILKEILGELGSTQTTIELEISAGELFIRLAEVTQSAEFEAAALLLLERAEITAEQANLPRLKSYAIGHQGRILVNQGKYHDALNRLATATFLATSTQSFESAYLWQWQTARAFRRQGKTDAAIEGYRTSIRTLEYVRQELITGSPFTYPQKIQPLFSELSDLLLSAAGESTRGNDQQSYLKQVQLVLEQAKSAELQDYFQNECVIPDKAVDLNNIDEATAVIYPVILQERLEVLINIDDRVYQFVQNISETDLTRLVNDFRDSLQRDQGDDEYKEIGEELYELIFAEAASLLNDKEIKTLLVIPDGTLRTIPFAAIYDGSEFLVEKYAIATTPGISLTLPKPLDVQKASLFAGGVSHAVQGFSGLPGVPVELAKLQNQYGAAVLQDQNFQRSAIQSQLASENYSVVHIATHGHFDSNPQESFLLTYDGRLTMDLLEQSISGRRQAGQPLELLVLSACETAVGDSRAALGLAGVALKAGARSAVATLWQISDEATVKVIDDFYEKTATDGLTKAQALRSAQIELIHSERFYHPTDWAPFLLIGNWL